MLCLKESLCSLAAHLTFRRVKITELTSIEVRNCLAIVCGVANIYSFRAVVLQTVHPNGCMFGHYLFLSLVRSRVMSLGRTFYCTRVIDYRTRVILRVNTVLILLC